MRGLLIALGALALVPLGLGLATRERLAELQPPEAAKGFEVGELRLLVIDEGPIRLRPDRTVVLVHGAGGGVDDWQMLRPVLRERYRVVSMDRPGNGWSDPLPEGDDPALAANARVLRELLDLHGVQRPILLGASYGGAVVLRMAADDPGYPAGLVLVCSLAPGWSPFENGFGPFMGLGILLSVPGLGAVIDRAVLPSVVAFTPASVWWNQLYGPEWQRLPEPMLERNLLAMQRPKRIRVREGRPMLDELDALRPALGRIEAPAIVLTGELDPMVPSALGEALADALPRARHVVVPGGRHAVAVMEPELVAEYVHEVAASARLPAGRASP